MEPRVRMIKDNPRGTLPPIGMTKRKRKFYKMTLSLSCLVALKKKVEEKPRQSSEQKYPHFFYFFDTKINRKEDGWATPITKLFFL